MKRTTLAAVLAGLSLALALVITGQAQQDTSTMQQNGAEASRPAPALNGPGTADVPTPELGQSRSNPAPAGQATATPNQVNVDDNPYDPLLEPPPLPKGKATLIGGIATNVDHVRNRITIQPFGKGQKVKVLVDERSHIYRNGAETTILSVRKGDRVYLDTQLDPSNNKILARNVRVLTELGVAEVRGQVTSANLEKGTISVHDQLSARPVTFAVGPATRYSSSKGSATAGDVQPGSLIDVQFAPRRDERAVAEQVMVLAKPGDNYIFSGKVTNLDMRTNSFFVDNRSDDQSYEVHFNSATIAEARQLKVGAEVTARTVFDGKQYTASNIRIEDANQEVGEQSKAQ